MTADPEPLVVWAQRAGELALPLFGIALLLLLVIVALAAWAWDHPRLTPLRDRHSAAPPWAQLVLMLALGFAVIAGAGHLFVEIAEGVVDGGVLGRADQAVTDAIRVGVPEPVVRVFAAVTNLGDPATLAVLCAVVALWLWSLKRRWLAGAFVLTVAGSGLLNLALKQIFARVRPEHLDGQVQAHGYSFPSGHSSGSIVVYGMLAYLALRLLPPRWHLPVVLAATALAFTVAASRVFLRVHFASDVLAGLASGLAWLTVAIVCIEITRRWHRAAR